MPKQPTDPNLEEVVQIRSAQLNDAVCLADLCAQLGYLNSVESIKLVLQTSVGNPQRATFVAIASSGKALGFIDIDIRQGLLTPNSAEISALIIDEQARGKGYGKRLVNRAEEWAIEMGAQQITVKSNTIRTNAHSFYQRLGYESYKQQIAFHKHIPAT